MNHLTYELEYMKNIYTEMLELVNSQLNASIKALLNQNVDLAEEVIRKELRVNAYELNIEKSCENIIALFQPVASNLRQVVSTLKSISELERIGDHAKYIARLVIDKPETFPKNFLKKFLLEEMAQLLAEMFDLIINAFETKTTENLRKIFKLDKKVNKLYKQSIKEMESELDGKGSKGSDVLTVYAINSRLERTGDLLTNIAEELIFYLDAEVLKHSKTRKLQDKIAEGSKQ